MASKDDFMQEQEERSNSVNSFKRQFRHAWKPKIVTEWTEIWKQRGFRALVKEKGWKIVVAVFLFYLVRDSFLYILLPYFAARGLFGC